MTLPVRPLPYGRRHRDLSLGTSANVNTTRVGQSQRYRFIPRAVNAAQPTSSSINPVTAPHATSDSSESENPAMHR